MANIDLKNLNLEDIKNRILKFADKKTLIKIIMVLRLSIFRIKTKLIQVIYLLSQKIKSQLELTYHLD